MRQSPAGTMSRQVTRSPASAGIANRPLVFATRTTLSGHNTEYLCLNLFTLRGFNNNESSIAGTKMIPFASYKAPQTQSRLPSPTK